MVLDASLLITQNYKVRIKGKVEQSRESSRNTPNGVVATENEAFVLPSTIVTNIIYIYIFIYIYIYI